MRSLFFVCNVGSTLRLFGVRYALPSTARSYQALTFYPAFAYGLDTDGSDSADFRIVGVSNRGLSGVVYRIKVARVCSKQGRRNAWGARIGKIADAEFHARKIKRQPPISNDLVKRDGQKWQTCNNQNNSFWVYVYGSL